jgi:hypothetical protein
MRSFITASLVLASLRLWSGSAHPISGNPFSVEAIPGSNETVWGFPSDVNQTPISVERRVSSTADVAYTTNCNNPTISEKLKTAIPLAAAMAKQASEATAAGKNSKAFVIISQIILM